MAAKRNVTFQDIADYTHFSKTTISRYFNKPETLSVKNREKIAAALESLHYNENKVAQILARGHSEFIGLLIPNAHNNFYTMIEHMLTATYEKYVYKFLVFPGGQQSQSERKYIQELLAYKIEGLIVLSHTMPSIELASFGIPVVSIEREDLYISSVNTDNYMGGVQATGLLYKNGCKYFYLMESPTAPDVPAFGRIRGFLDTCQEHDLPYRILEYNLSESYEDSADAIRARLDEAVIGQHPGELKGIFCTSDNAAIIVENSLIRRFGTLPEEYRIVGFDNIPAAREAAFPITTIGQQMSVMVDSAMELLMEQISAYKEGTYDPDAKPKHIIIPPKLVVRETTDVPRRLRRVVNDEET